MPKSTHGVIEIRKNPSGWWDGVVNIEAMVDQVPDVTGVLFDVDNLKGLKPIASRRGIPTDCSFMTEILERELSATDFNMTWIRPDEIHHIFKVKNPTKGWATIFSLMDMMEEQYGEGNVRLVAWFT